MKATELMIGDWVDFYHFYEPEKKIVTRHRVTDIYGSCLDGLVGISNHQNPVHADHIEPVKITPEILEKNGFEVQDQGGGRRDVWIGFGVDCEGDIEVEFKYNVPVYLKIDGGFKGEYYTSANIKYIHQLQHALRLCGIEKEIIM